MQFTELTDQDRHLVDQAVEVSDRLYLKDIQEVSAALQTAGGQVFTGIHFEASTGFATVCGEVAAISCMVAAGHRDLETIVAVWRGPEGQHVVLPPCGRCREVVSDFNLRAWVILSTAKDHWNDDAINHLAKVRVSDLLPLKSHELKS